MKLIGAGWVGSSEYGAVHKDLCGAYSRLNTLYHSLLADEILRENTAKFGRFNRSTQRAFCATALALHDGDGSAQGHPVALIGTGGEECTLANQTYFKDYVQNGRRMARANLFIYTLPTSPLAELAIHFKLNGPLFFTTATTNTGANLARSARSLLSAGDAARVLALWSEKDFTAALLFEAAESVALDPFQFVETPEQFIANLKENL